MNSICQAADFVKKSTLKNAAWILNFAAWTWVKCGLDLLQMQAGKYFLRLAFEDVKNEVKGRQRGKC